MLLSTTQLLSNKKSLYYIFTLIIILLFPNKALYNYEKIYAIKKLAIYENLWL